MMQPIRLKTRLLANTVKYLLYSVHTKLLDWGLGPISTADVVKCCVRSTGVNFPDAGEVAGWSDADAAAGTPSSTSLRVGTAAPAACRKVLRVTV